MASQDLAWLSDARLTVCPEIVADKAVLRPLHAYALTHATGEPVHLEQAFLATAHIEGYRDGDFVSWDLPSYAAVFDGAASDELSRSRRVERLDVRGSVATAVMTLRHGDFEFTDVFVLVRRPDGTWRIANKAYERRQAHLARLATQDYSHCNHELQSLNVSSERASMGHHHHAIDYVEIPAPQLETCRSFYSAAFGWTFNDYGPEYAGIRGPDPDGPEAGGLAANGPAQPLVLLYSEDLDATLHAVVAAGGTVVVEPYEFPGGRRFHFSDPSGNELGVWGPSSQSDAPH